MRRRIINIDEEKCNGCGACADACHEGAIAMVEGKARLLRDDYCDGLGDCLPACPTGAITFVEREAAEYNELAVLARKLKKDPNASTGGCPGLQAKKLAKPAPPAEGDPVPSQLAQWPCQIKLAPVEAPYFAEASMLIAADCTAFAYGSIHRDFMAGRITLVGCPKLDAVDYSEKLGEIFRSNDVRDVTVLRMEVPCCGGMEKAVRKAVEDSGKSLAVDVVTIAMDGTIKK